MRAARWMCLLWVLLVMCASAAAAAEMERAGGYWQIVDETGAALLETAREVAVDDMFLSPENVLYRVWFTRGLTACARRVGEVDIDRYIPSRLRGEMATGASEGESPRGKVGIYHTHTNESYLPTEGRRSIPGRGGILKVGDAMRRAFARAGIEVLHSRVAHDPPDVMAYDRSRRTAVRLLRAGADVLFDVHRDAVPRRAYEAVIRGKRVARVLIVLGRQNPALRANEGTAFALKGVADRSYPGLVRGIFYARGRYNQDLFPRALLLEVGTLGMPREEAERGVGLFASVADEVLFAPAPPAREAARERESRGAGRAAAAVLGLAAAGVLAYVYINEGWRGIARRLRRFGRMALAVIGSRRRGEG